MSQLHFFYGTNTYQMFGERSRWVTEFKAKHGDTNLLLLDGNKTSFKDLKELGSQAPFGAEKRLLVVSDLPRGQKGVIADLESALHPATLVLFLRVTDTDYKPKLTIPGKELLEAADCKFFATVKGTALKTWLSKQAQAAGANITDASRDYLIDKVGEDQQLLDQELSKLALYKGDEEITLEDINLLAALSAEREVWHVLDLIGKQHFAAALAYINQLTEQGASAQALWSTMLWMLAGLTHMKALLEAGNTNAFSIAGTIRMAPNSVKSLMPMVKAMPIADLERLVNLMTEADRRLKVGEYKTSSESEVELLAVLDLTILSFA